MGLSKPQQWNSTDQKVEQDEPHFMMVKFQNVMFRWAGRVSEAVNYFGFKTRNTKCKKKQNARKYKMLKYHCNYYFMKN